MIFIRLLVYSKHKLSNMFWYDRKKNLPTMSSSGELTTERVGRPWSPMSAMMMMLELIVPQHLFTYLDMCEPFKIPFIR